MFLRYLFAFVLIITATTASAERFEFPAEGFSIESPDGWPILDPDDVGKEIENSDFGEYFKQLSRRNRGRSLLIAAVRDRPPIGVTPGFSVNVYPGRIRDTNLAAAKVLETVQQNVRELTIIQAPVDDRLGDFRATRMIYRYVTERHGIDFTIQERLWLVPHGDRYLVINTGIAPTEGIEARNALDKTVQSLRRLP